MPTLMLMCIIHYTSKYAEIADGSKLGEPVVNDTI